MSQRSMFDPTGLGFPGIVGQDSAMGYGGVSAPDINWGSQDVGITGPVGMPSDALARPDWMGAQNPMDPGWFGINGFGLNAPTIGMGLSGLKTMGNLWGGLQALSLAKKQFNYTKKTTDANMANQLSSYNTALEDRARSRASFTGGGPAEADAYIAAHKLPTRA